MLRGDVGSLIVIVDNDDRFVFVGMTCALIRVESSAGMALQISVEPLVRIFAISLN